MNANAKTSLLSFLKQSSTLKEAGLSLVKVLSPVMKSKKGCQEVAEVMAAHYGIELGESQRGLAGLPGVTFTGEDKAGVNTARVMYSRIAQACGIAKPATSNKPDAVTLALRAFAKLTVREQREFLKQIGA